jgi:hypothetical protein
MAAGVANQLGTKRVTASKAYRLRSSFKLAEQRIWLKDKSSVKLVKEDFENL